MKIERKRLITAGGTLFCALGIGYFMQSSAQPPATATPVDVAAAGVSAVQQPAAVLDQSQTQAPSSANASGVSLDEVTLTSAAPTKPEIPAVAEAPVVQAALEVEPDSTAVENEAPDEQACENLLDAYTEAAAMVRLELSAPCLVQERFTLHHNGMMFSHVTDEMGKAELTVPALDENAIFIVAFANGEGAVANASVSSLEYYDRAVVQWRGEAGMQIHALEYGSDYGGEGHVSLDSERDISTAALGEGGFITRLGSSDLDDALWAEVYTFPSGVAGREGEVSLRVEAEVTERNCGRDIEAQSIQKGVDGQLKTQDLVLSMPDCTAVGDFLVLKNLLNDLKIASK